MSDDYTLVSSLCNRCLFLQYLTADCCHTSQTKVTPEKDRGLGAVRQCNMYSGNKAVEKIIEWDEKNRAYKIELIDTDMPMKAVIASLSVEPAGANKSKLKAHMVVKAKFGPIGKVSRL